MMSYSEGYPHAPVEYVRYRTQNAGIRTGRGFAGAWMVGFPLPGCGAPRKINE